MVDYSVYVDADNVCQITDRAGSIRWKIENKGNKGVRFGGDSELLIVNLEY